MNLEFLVILFVFVLCHCRRMHSTETPEAATSHVQNFLNRSFSPSVPFSYDYHTHTLISTLCNTNNTLFNNPVLRSQPFIGTNLGVERTS